MSDIINRALQIKIDIIYFLFFSSNALGVAAMTALASSDLSSHPTMKYVLIGITIYTNWTNSMLAFMYKTQQRINQGKTFIPSEDTIQITKSQINETKTNPIGGTLIGS